MVRHTAFLAALLMILAAGRSAEAGGLKPARLSKISGLPSSVSIRIPAAALAKTAGVSVKGAHLNPVNARTASLPGGKSGGSPFLRTPLPLPQALSPVSDNLAVSWNSATGVPRQIIVTPRQGKPVPVQQAAADPVDAARGFLESNRNLLRISDPNTEFAVMSTLRDELGVSHVRFQQMFGGIEVWGSDLYLHVDPRGGVVMLNGTYHATPSLELSVPRVTAGDALAAVSRMVAGGRSLAELTPALQRLMNYSGPAARRVIWYDGENFPHQAWFVEMRTALDRDWYCFVDAETGTLLDSYNNAKTDGPTTGSGTDLNGATRSFGTYAVGSDYYMIDVSQPMYNATSSTIPQDPVGAIVALDLRNNDLSAQSTMYYVMSSNNQWSDASAISAQYNAAQTYNFYRQVFGRNSIDNQGMTIYSLVHVTSDGQPMDNAFWSGGLMCYGDGNTAFKPLAGGFDVAAHEMTHGVTEHSANLVYKNQSGALNESMSDAFAVALDSGNWTIGEQVMKDLTTYPSGALRDLSNPHNGGSEGDPAWQPATMDEFVNTTEDNGGVHINSGIPNNAFYRVAVAIGRSRASAVWYKALTGYLTSSAQFVDARIATEAAAKELYGDPSAELTAVKDAWDAVHVYEGAGTAPPPGSTLSGENWVLALNTSSSDPNSLYKIKSTIQSAADFFPLSTTPVLTRPAVTDTSGVVLFVDQNNDLRALSANDANPGETVLDSSGVWWSVAVGPGLGSIALTSKYVDTTIYYYNALTNQTREFKIRTIAYDGTAAGTALYADALTFDPTGRYILFDSYNRTTTVQGDTISFWTIELLDVTTGEMRSVFPPQPAGVDIGNPSFSKTSGYRFTFDYWDEGNSEGYVLAADLFYGKIGQVAGPLPVPGYPTYSGNDGVIAFHTLESISTETHDVVQQIAVDTSHIVGSGSPADYVVDATYPVWFVIGNRVTSVENGPKVGLPAATELLQNYPNPFNPTTEISYRIASSGMVLLRVYDILGREVVTLVNQPQSAGLHTVSFTASGLASGVYFYRLEAAGMAQTKKLVLLR